jgi:hypothetical protein
MSVRDQVNSNIGCLTCRIPAQKESRQRSDYFCCHELLFDPSFASSAEGRAKEGIEY